MHLKATFSIVVFLLISILIFAGEGKVNFTGEWSLNEEKSELGEGRRRMAATKLTINQEGNNLSIERLSQRRSGEEFAFKENLTLDGKECENAINERERTSIANWSEDGKNLTITSKMVFERDGNAFEINTVEIWSLIEEGKSLSMDYTSSSPRGERKTTYVYDKVNGSE